MGSSTPTSFRLCFVTAARSIVLVDIDLNFKILIHIKMLLHSIPTFHLQITLSLVSEFTAICLNFVSQIKVLEHRKTKEDT